MKFELTTPREEEDKALMAAITPDNPIAYISNEVAAGELRLIVGVDGPNGMVKFGFHVYDAYAELRAKLNELATNIQTFQVNAEPDSSQMPPLVILKNKNEPKKRGKATTREMKAVATAVQRKKVKKPVSRLTK